MCECIGEQDQDEDKSGNGEIATLCHYLNNTAIVSKHKQAFHSCYLNKKIRKKFYI